MDAEHYLEKYLISHPDYWEFEDEKLEVNRLKALVRKENNLAGLKFDENYKAKLLRTSVSLAV
jgi:hypothetical protein